jgi:mannosyltransferase
MTAASPKTSAGRIGILLVLAGALALRLWNLGARSLWTDEASTWTASHGSFAELFRFCAMEDASPPLFYALTRLALYLGDSEAMLRLVSVVASVAIVWLVYRLARLYAGRGEAVLAAALVAVSPYQWMFAQEARTYMLVAAWMTAATWFFARAVWRPGRRDWLWYALALAGAFYTQTIGWLAVGAHGCFILLSRDGRRQWRPFALALLGAIWLYVPWLVASMQQAGHLPQSHWYIPAPDARGSFQVLRAILISPVPLVSTAPGEGPGLGDWLPAPLAYALLLLAPLLPLALALPRAREASLRGAVLRLAAGGLILPLLAVFVVSLRSPLWLPRYFVFTTPLLALWLAAGVLRVRPPVLRTAWIVALFTIAGFAGLRYDASFTKEPWREVARTIAAERSWAPERRVTVLVPFDADAMRYYFRRASDAPRIVELSHADDPFSSDFTPAQLDAIEAVARDAAREADDVWVVVRSANSDARREVARRAESVAAEGRIETTRRTWESSLGPVDAARFSRADPDTAR